MKSERIMALSIAKLGLTAYRRNKWVQLVMEYKSSELFPELKSAYGEKWLRTCDELARKLTVKDVIDAHVASMCNETKGWRRPVVPRVDKQLTDKLVQLGLTQLDWIVLPSSSVSTKKLKLLGKEELCRRSILVLGTLSSTALIRLEHLFNKDSPAITIQDLITISVRQWSGDCHGKFDRSVAGTRQKLRELRFRYEDGAFFQDGTKRQLAEDLMEKEGLSQMTARKVAEIAAKRHWVSCFVE